MNLRPHEMGRALYHFATQPAVCLNYVYGSSDGITRGVNYSYYIFIGRNLKALPRFTAHTGFLTRCKLCETSQSSSSRCRGVSWVTLIGCARKYSSYQNVTQHVRIPEYGSKLISTKMLYVMIFF